MPRTNSHFDANVFFVQRMLEQLEQYLIDISSESLCIENVKGHQQTKKPSSERNRIDHPIPRVYGLQEIGDNSSED